MKPSSINPLIAIVISPRNRKINPKNSMVSTSFFDLINITINHFDLDNKYSQKGNIINPTRSNPSIPSSGFHLPSRSLYIYSNHHY